MSRTFVASVGSILFVLGVFFVPASSETEVKQTPPKSQELKDALKRNEVLKEELTELRGELRDQASRNLDLTQKHKKDLGQIGRQKLALEAALTSRGIDLPKEAGDGRDPVTAPMIARMLNELVETKGLQEPVMLKVAVEYLGERFGGRIPIVVDRAAFAAQFGDDSVSPYEESVVLPPVPARMHLSTALRLLLSQVGKGQATYVIRRGFIEIVPEKYTTAPYFLYQPMIGAAYTKRPLGEILNDLADETGITIDLDPGVGKKKAITPITTTFRNCSLEDALTTVTEMAQLKYVVLHRSIFVTTAERAMVLEKEEAIRREKRKSAPRMEKGKRLEPAAD